MIDWIILGQQLINGLVLGSIYGLIAIGYSMVYGIIGMINFAHGDVYMISAYLTAIAIALCTLVGISALPLTLLLTLIFATLITGLYGWGIERTAYRPLRFQGRLSPLISAIGMSLVLENFVLLSQGAGNKDVPALIKGQIELGPVNHAIIISHIELIIIIVAIISLMVLNLIISKTSLGRSMRATQQDIMMAAILGINVDQIISFVFIIGSVMAAVAGVLVSLNFGSFNFFIGFIVGMKAFTSAVLGGIGSLSGAMLGGMILGLSESLFAGYISTDYKDVFAFALLIFILIVKPSGLLGRPEIEKV